MEVVDCAEAIRKEGSGEEFIHIFCCSNFTTEVVQICRRGEAGAGNSVLSRGTACVCVGCGGKGHGLKDRLTVCFHILVVAGDTFLSGREESLSVSVRGGGSHRDQEH